MAASKKQRARGLTNRKPGEMNKLEAAWALELETRRIAGEISQWWYEPMSLRLAKGSHYKPDFMIVLADGLVEFHETKGYMQEAANVRLKVAAEKFPQFLFRLVKKKLVRDGGGFSVTVVGAKV
jgi:hypothetical protein